MKTASEFDAAFADFTRIDEEPHRAKVEPSMHHAARICVSTQALIADICHATRIARQPTPPTARLLEIMWTRTRLSSIQQFRLRQTRFGHPA
jgi:hypothetical protein